MKEEIIALLDELAITYRWVDHPAVFTVAESMEHLEDKVPIKNLLLQDNKTKDLYLVIMEGQRKLDMKQLAAMLGVKKFSFAKPELLKEKLGVDPGSVSIFGLINNQHNDVQVVVDEMLTRQDEIGFHPNDNTATLFIAGAKIATILESTGNTFQLLKF